MPRFCLETNIPSKQIPENFMSLCVQNLSKLTGKPETFCVCFIQTDQNMFFGDDDKPCAIANISSIGGLGIEDNKRYCNVFFKLIEEYLGISQKKIWLTFTENLPEFVTFKVIGIVDSLPPGLLEGRPAGNSFFVTSHQLQQLQQQLQAAAVATASHQQQTEQVATASGGLTLALHHTAGGGTGVLTPQLLLASQATPSFTAYPVTSAAQHTTSIQQVLQHHVRLQSTIQQIGSQQAQQQSYTETSNGIINGNSKCIPVSPASPFSSRSLTPSPQQRVLTPQPVFQQVMNATVPVLQLYQPAARTTNVAAAALTQPKNKPPQQILPKPITNIMTQTTIKPPATQTNTQAGTLLLNQMIPNTGVIVGQQTNSGVQLILKSPSPQSISTSVPKAQVVSSNGSLTTSPNTIFVQANRSQPQQVVRLITGQSLQLQQVQTSSGPAFVAVPSLQPTLQQTNSTQTATVVPSVTTVPVQTSVFNQNVIKKTNHINTNCINNQNNNNFNSNNNKKKKRREEETTKLDLANLIKISGIDEEDVALTPTSVSSSSSLSSLSSASSASQSPPTSCSVQTSSPSIVAPNHRFHVEPQSQIHFQQEQLNQQQNQPKIQQFVPSRPPTPKQNNTPLLSQIQTSAAPQCGLRFSIADDGNVILHQSQIASQNVTASVAAAAQTQLAQLVAEHGNNLLQTAVLSLTGSESFVLKTPTGFTIRQPQMVLQRTSTTPNVVLAPDALTATNGVRIMTDVGGINGLAGKVQFVSSNTMQDHNRVQIVTGVQNPSTVSLTEQQRVQIVTAGVPDIGSMSLTTEQQNHVQILTSVPNSTAEVSLTEQQQNRMEIISNVPSTTTTVNEQKSRIQVIPNSRTVSLTEQLVSDISQQILTNVPSSSNIHEQNTRVIFQNTERNNEHLHISSSERTDVHITANNIPEAISNQQTKLQMITNLPQNCAISLNEQNRFHIIPNTEFAVDDKTHANDSNKLEHLQIDQSDMQHTCTAAQVDNQRFQVFSNVEVNDEQNRIIVEHQRVLNTSTMAINEQQNRLHVISGCGNEQQQQQLQHQQQQQQQQQQRLLHQLEEQRKIQIITKLPQCIMQLNEQQSKLAVKNIDSFEQLQQQQQPQQQRLHISTNQNAPSMPKLNVQIKDHPGNLPKFNHMPNICETKFSNEFQDKLPDTLNNELTTQTEFSGVNENIKLNNQNLLPRTNCVDTIKSRNTFDQRTSPGVNGTTSNQTYKSGSKNNIACSPSSVISPSCTPSPHSPFNNKSPSSYHSPQSPVVPTQNIINSCFSNRPNLTVVTQSSLSSINNQNIELGPTPLQGKPCAAVISHSVPHTSNILLPNSNVDHHGKLNFLNGSVENCDERFVTNSQVLNLQTTSSSTSPPPATINIQSPSSPALIQNSFLNTIAQSNSNIPLNKTGIVQPCSKQNVIRGKKPKKSAVVKPMVFQPEDKDKISDGPACLNPVSNDGSHSSVVQRVQTIQLTPQKQQSLKVVQSQIAVLSGKKTRTPQEQATLQKLFNEQQKILLSGKIIPTIPGQNTQGLTFVSTPVRLVPPPSTSPSPHPPTTPPTCNKATSPLHVQVGTQTTLDEPVTIPFSPLPPLSPLPLPAPAPPQQPTLPVLTPAKRASLICEQLEIDQRSVTQPDTNTPFNSISDACKRLLRYHCFDEPILSEKDLEKADEIFEATAKHLLDKNAQMLNKYSYLLCKESMREVQTSELIMLGRMFVADETQLLEQMKNELNAGSNPPNMCSIATQVNPRSPLTVIDGDLTSASDGLPSVCQFDTFISASSRTESHQKLKREFDESDSISNMQNDVKRHRSDHEEINAQVQSAIDSILNLQRSDSATDEAVRSILPS